MKLSLTLFKVITTISLLAVLVAGGFLVFKYFITPIQAGSGSANINFNTEADYIQEDVKDTGSVPIANFNSTQPDPIISACTAGNQVCGHLQDSSFSNVDISGSKIKVGDTISVFGIIRRIAIINDAATGLITLDGQVTNYVDSVDYIYGSKFIGGTAALGSNLMQIGQYSAGFDAFVAYDGNSSAQPVVWASAGSDMKKFNAANGMLLSTVTMGYGVENLTYDSANKKIWTAYSGNGDTVYLQEADAATAVAGSVYSFYVGPAGSITGMVYDSVDDAIIIGTHDYCSFVPSTCQTYILKIHASGGSVGTQFSGSPYIYTNGQVGSATSLSNAMTYDPVNNYLWFIKYYDKSISRISAGTPSTETTVSLLESPYNVVFNSSDQSVWVDKGISNYNTLTHLSSGAAVLGSVFTGSYSNGLAIDPQNNALWRANAYSGYSRYDLATNTSSTVSVPNNYAAHIIFDPSSNAIWSSSQIGSGNLVKIGGGAPTFAYYTTITSDTSRADSSSWLQLNSMIMTAGGEGTFSHEYFSLSFDGRNSFKIWNGTAWRTIASSKNADTAGGDGNWYYLTNGDIWTAAQANNAQRALSQAAAESNNQMGSGSLTDTQLMASGGWTSSVNTVDMSATFVTQNPYTGAFYTSPYIDNVVLGYATPAVVQFTSTSGTGPETTASVAIPVQIDSVFTGNVSVDYTVTGGTAVSGTNYTLAAGQVTIGNPLTSADINLAVLHDNVSAPSKTVVITLSNPVNASLGVNTVYTYTITDTDTPTFKIYTDAGFTQQVDGTNFTVGDTLYFKFNDASFAGGTIAVSSTTGDSKTVSVTNIGSATYTGSVATSGTSGGSPLYVVNGSTVTGTYSVGSTTSIDNFSSYADTAALTNGAAYPHWNDPYGSPITLETVSANNFLQDTVPGANPYGAIAQRVSAPINFGSQDLTFKVKIDSTSFLSNFGNMGLQNGDPGFPNAPLFHGLDVLVTNGTNFAWADVSSQVTSANAWVTVSVAQSAFVYQLNQTGTPAPLFSGSDWTSVPSVMFVAVTNGNALALQLDDLALSSQTLHSSTTTATTNAPLGGNVELTASVEPTISYTLDTANCNFGGLVSSTVKTCVVNVVIATNATSGYTAYIKDVNNGTLNSSSDNINAVIGTSLSAGTEGFGIATSVISQGLVQETNCVNGSSINVQSATTSNQTFSSANAPVLSDGVALCMAASITDTTPAGSYSDTAYITVVGNF